MNKTDSAILQALQKNSQLSMSVLAEKINLSTSACHRRVKLLEESGVIKGYSAYLDSEKIGYNVLVYSEISLSSQTDECFDTFESAVKNCAEVLECHMMSGNADYLIKVAASSTAHYEKIHRRTLTRLPGIASMRSNFVLKTIQPWEGYLVTP